MSGMVFSCSSCGASITSDDALCGQVATCPDCGEDVMVPIPGLKPGMEVGDFRLVEPLGSGAMGEVWLAEQASMDRRVALKILFPHLASDKRFVDRFLKEVRNSAKLSHPNIVTAFHAGMDKGVHYLAISFVSGRSVADILEEEGAFEEGKALRVALDMASALEYAWNEFKILHRDIKPANIIVNDKGAPMLLDMGISKSVDDDVSLTMTGTVVGTPHYMSPEQAVSSEDLDFRSDIYSLGTTLYHMLAGEVPFEAPTAMAVIMKHINDELPPLREKNPEVSSNCEALVALMMEKKRERRPQSWAALRKEIQAVLDGKSPKLPPTGKGTGSADGVSEGEASPKPAYSAPTRDGRTDTSEGEDASDRRRRKALLLVGFALGCVALLVFSGVVAAVLVFRGGTSPKRPSNGDAPVSSVKTVSVSAPAPETPPVSDVKDASPHIAPKSTPPPSPSAAPASADTAAASSTPPSKAVSSIPERPAPPPSVEDDSVKDTHPGASLTSRASAEAAGSEKSSPASDNSAVPPAPSTIPAPSASPEESSPPNTASSPVPASKPASTPAAQAEKASNSSPSKPSRPAKPSAPDNSSEPAKQPQPSERPKQPSSAPTAPSVPSAPPKPKDELSMAFAQYASNLDLTKNTAVYTKQFWSKSVGSEHTWKGKVVYVKSGRRGAEVRVACPERMLYKGFNVILVTRDRLAAGKLKIGQEITFKGDVYSYKHKWSGLVIVYMKNVKFLGTGGEADE